jgi:hypothetical protein
MQKARFTKGIKRSELTKRCFDEKRMWPGWGTVREVVVLRDHADRFLVRVTIYGAASKAAC